ncbi:MAG: hypothetical protein EXS58_18100 [Candidatus Latescibacteria bacterium]|nr:hypothetical protein [Candidatus Latescibacterota bacterium]
MRAILAGIEYSGKSTLIQLLDQYYRHHKCPTHTDDHFSIPDASLSPASQALMVGFPDDVKERSQRMQIHYHVEVIKNYAHTLIGGWHLEEAVYSAVYGSDPENTYYKNYGYRFQRLYESQVLEAHLPDIVLVHLTASDEAIRQRMQASPHPYQIIKEKDIARLKQLFAEEIDKSLFTHKGFKIELDTTGKTPQQSLDELLLLSEPRITAGELAMRAMLVPAGEYEVKYEGGVRHTVPKS